jgi:hypothetical protein
MVSPLVGEETEERKTYPLYIRVESWLSHRIALCASQRKSGDACRVPTPINKTLAIQASPVISGLASCAHVPDGQRIA